MNEPYDESCDVYSFGIVLWYELVPLKALKLKTLTSP